MAVSQVAGGTQRSWIDHHPAWKAQAYDSEQGLGGWKEAESGTLLAPREELVVTMGQYKQGVGFGAVFLFLGGSQNHSASSA